jgi:hypothetical protein
MVIVSKNSNTCEKRFDALLEALIDGSRITATDADAAKLEYAQFIRSNRQDFEVRFCCLMSR